MPVDHVHMIINVHDISDMIHHIHGNHIEYERCMGSYYVGYPMSMRCMMFQIVGFPLFCVPYIYEFYDVYV